MSDSIKDAKRFKLFDQAYLWFGKNKITIGDVGSGEHFTMLVNKDGILDAHKTIEGSEKKYESLLKLDLKELAEHLKTSNFEKNFEEDVKKNIQKITFSEPEFSECKVVLVKSEEEMNSLARVEKRKVILDESAINEEEHIPWANAKDRVKEKALVLDKTGSSIGYLFSNGQDVFFMKGDYMMESYFTQLITQFASFYNDKEEDDVKTSEP